MVLLLKIEGLKHMSRFLKVFAISFVIALIASYWRQIMPMLGNLPGDDWLSSARIRFPIITSIVISVVLTLLLNLILSLLRD